MDPQIYFADQCRAWLPGIDESPIRLSTHRLSGSVGEQADCSLGCSTVSPMSSQVKLKLSDAWKCLTGRVTMPK